MKRYYIIEGDVTSVGGVVQRHTGSAQTTKVYDKIVSNIGDKINCPACGSVGIIKAVGHRQPFGNHSNIPAMQEDICVCNCSPPPVLKHSQKLFYQNVESSFGVGDVINLVSNLLPKTQQNLNNSFTDNRKFENYYIERNKTDYVKFKTVIPLYDPDKRGFLGAVLQMGSGTCEFIVTYIVKDKRLFVTVSYIPPVLKHDAKIYPDATLRLYKENSRKFELLSINKLKSEGGIWNTERGKEPVGFVNITLPEPDLSLLKVELQMGYEAKLDGGTIYPTPRFVKHSFTLNSVAREIK